jgi:hypothetical protein
MSHPIVFHNINQFFQSNTTFLFNIIIRIDIRLLRVKNSVNIYFYVKKGEASIFTPSFSFCTVYLMMATSGPKHVVAVY